MATNAKGFLSLVLVVLLFSIAGTAEAQTMKVQDSREGGATLDIITSVPRVMTYQGILKDGDGNPVGDGNYNITFRIYDAAVDGSLLWMETITVSTADGFFTDILGNTSALDLPFDDDYYLSLQVTGDTEMADRQKFTMSAYSARSDTCDYALNSAADDDWVISGDNMYSGVTDNVGIGISNPTNKLHIYGSDSAPLLNVEKVGPGRGLRVNTTSACALWVDNSGNHGLRVTYANGNGVNITNAGNDGIHVENAGNWAGYFNGPGYFSGNVGIGTAGPTEQLDVAGTAQMTGFKMPTGASNGYVLTSDGSGVGTWQATSGGGSNWSVTDSVLFTNNYWGIARGGAGNALYGDSANTMVNLGVSCITGTSGQNYLYSTVSGGVYNTASHTWSTVSGGYGNDASGGGDAIGGGRNNTTASSEYSTISGGDNNTASYYHSTVSGGQNNTAQGTGTTVGGGKSNTASNVHSTVGGGTYNTATSNYATVGGGYNNTANGSWSTVGGGSDNTASNQSSTVGGGYNNTASGNYSFAAGRRAKANHAGSFVWADQTDADFASTAADQFLIRASGGVGIGTANPGYKLDVQGTVGIDVGSNFADIPLTISVPSNHAGLITRIAKGGSVINVVDSAGNVGIGTFSPAAKLDVNGTANMTGFKMATGASSGYVLTSDGLGTGTWQAASSVADSDWTISGSDLYSAVTGNIGIGTSSPDYKLDVLGSVGIDVGSFYGSIPLTIDVPSNQDGLIFRIAKGGSVINVVDSAGNYGIGTFSPTEKLDVVGTAQMTGFKMATGASSGYVLTSDGAGAGTWQAVAGGGSNWSVTDSVLYTDNYWGIARGGAGNVLYGSSAHTMINLGVACTTGTSGQNYLYSTVSGGYINTAFGHASTVGGGYTNTASGAYATVGGGQQNTASASYSTVSGGYINTASGHGSVASGYNNTASSNYSTVGGGNQNTSSGLGSTVSGGLVNIASGDAGTVGGGRYNKAPGHYAVVSGGGGSSEADSNSASGDYSAIGGGKRNIASGQKSTVGGGNQNTAIGTNSTIGGGEYNNASVYASVSGGYNNTASGNYSSVGGGNGNTASGEFSAVPGGHGNFATGNYSFAVGTNSKANHAGSIVMAANSSTLYSDSVHSGGNEQMVLRADGGMYITNTGGLAPYDATNIITTRGGAYLSGNGTSWTNSSDRNMKENFAAVDNAEILEKIASLPISEWNYKSESDDVKHIGPVAQDFKEVFGLGNDDKSISTIDPSGIALAGIQELLAKIEALETEIAELKASR